MNNEKYNGALSSAAVEAEAAKQNLPQGRIVWARPDPPLETSVPEFPARDFPESSRVPVSFIKEARTESHLAALYGSSALLRFFKTSQSAPRTDNVQTIYREARHFPQMCPNAMPSRRKEADPESRDYLIVRFSQGSL